ncbi:MAG: FtsX-like permease family protein [Algicola sp.]|nr:FtsX-like permease family protein [Algicola sp.]
MLINYFTTATRAFKKDSQHFLLNVFGLSVGLAAAILVALFTLHEFSYDRQQPDAERVYRIAHDFSKIGMGSVRNTHYRNYEISLKHSQVEDAFVLSGVGTDKKTNVQYQGQGYKLTDIFGATPNIEDFINISTLAGDLQIVLTTPDTLALSESEALRIFGKTDVIGETLLYEGGQHTLRAVFTDLPQNTHFAFKGLAYKEHDPANAWDFSNAIYIKLTAQADFKAYEKLLDEQAVAHPSMGKMPLSLVPLVDLHFTAKSKTEFKKGGDKQNVMICVGLSVLLILIASFNFINMTIAQSTKRAKEVGVRKALGATKSQLVVQFLSESVLLSLLATVIACSLVELMLPGFNGLVGRELTLDYRSSFSMAIVLMSLFVGIFAGLYPALFISSFSAKRVLSGDLQHGSTATLVRKCLLVLQATISIALIITTVVMNQQLAYLQSIPLGYETKQRLVISEIPAEHVYAKDTPLLLDKLNNIEGVHQSTVLGYYPTESPFFGVDLIWPNGEKSNGAIPITGSGFNIVEGLGLKLLAGRDFSAEFSGDWFAKASESNKGHVGAIITQSAAKQAGFSNVADIIGKTISDPNPQFTTDLHVVGVVADIIIANGQTELIFMAGYPNTTVFNVVMTIDVQNLPYIQRQVVELIGQHTNTFEPKIDLLVDSYKAVYRDDERISQIVSISTWLAIGLTLLGTFGMAAFSVLRRQKEVAVRKVLGASVLSIVNLLAKEFLLLVLLGIMFAFPLSYWLITDWLMNFNHRVEQSLWVYLAAAGFVGTITWLTVASLGFKAASTRPSLILRYE